MQEQSGETPVTETSSGGTPPSQVKKNTPSPAPKPRPKPRPTKKGPSAGNVPDASSVTIEEKETNGTLV